VVQPGGDVLDPLLGVLAQALEDELGDREVGHLVPGADVVDEQELWPDRRLGEDGRDVGGAALLEPGPVSSGVLDHVATYTLPDDPYAHLLTQGGVPASQMITPEEVAAGIADAAEAPQLPLRIPIGRPATQILAASQAAPDDRPFIPVHPRPPGRERQMAVARPMLAGPSAIAASPPPTTGQTRQVGTAPGTPPARW
jgi:hypothetical protein